MNPRVRTVVIVGIFVLTRLVLAYLADHPSVYGPEVTPIVAETDLFENWSSSLKQGTAYTEVKIEYPPGALPFVIIPGSFEGIVSYRTAYITLMLLLDGIGLIAIWKISSKWETRTPVYLWLAFPLLIGPMIYTRLDLAPAVATLWAFERFSREDWATGGCLLGLGTLIKFYPALFLLPAILIAPKRREPLFGFAVIAAVGVGLLLFLGSFDAFYENVIVYHRSRGIQMESTWGAGLFWAMKSGYPATIVHNYGALHIEGPVTPLLKTFSFASLLVVVGTSSWVALKGIPRGDFRSASVLTASLLSLAIAVSNVFSPQFLIWLASVAAIAGGANAVGRRLATLVLPAAAFTQFIYPFRYNDLFSQAQPTLTILTLRNLLLLGAGAWALLMLWRSDADAPRSSRRKSSPKMRMEEAIRPSSDES